MLEEDEFSKTKKAIAEALKDATRNHPPLKEDSQKILSELKKAFPELEALKGTMSKLPGAIGLSWFKMLHIFDLLRAIEREINKKPYNASRARRVFAYIVWLAYDLLFKEDLLRPEVGITRPDEQKETKRRVRAEAIQAGIIYANAFFRKRTGSNDVTLFREDVPFFFTKLPTRCESIDDFMTRIQSLASIFEVDLKPLRALVEKMDKQWGSIKLVERWLEENKLPGSHALTAVWKNIRRLRKAPPTHPNLSTDTIDALTFFVEEPPVNFTRLWDSILDKFLESLKEFQIIIRPP
jgi:hypothetical protein